MTILAWGLLCAAVCALCYHLVVRWRYRRRGLALPSVFAGGIAGDVAYCAIAIGLVLNDHGPLGLALAAGSSVALIAAVIQLVMARRRGSTAAAS